MDNINNRKDCDITNVDISHILKNNNQPNSFVNADSSSKFSRTHGSKHQKKSQTDMSKMLKFDDLNEFDKDVCLKTNTSREITIGIIGKRGSGKTTAIIDIVNYLKQNNRFDDCSVFSGSHQSNQIYKNKLGIDCHDKLNDDILEAIIQTQLKKITEFNQKIPKMLLILDDVLHQINTSKSKPLLELFFNSYHYGITLIFAIQFPLKFIPEIRTNIDVVLLGRDDCISNSKRLYDNYGGLFPTFESFHNVFKTIHHYSFMAIIRNGFKQPLEMKIKKFNPNEIETNLNLTNFIIDEIKNKPTNNIVDKNEIVGKKEKKSDKDKDKFIKQIAKCNSAISELMKNPNNDNNKIKIFKNIIKSNMCVLNYLESSSDEDSCSDSSISIKSIKSKKSKKSKKQSMNSDNKSTEHELIENFSFDSDSEFGI